MSLDEIRAARDAGIAGAIMAEAALSFVGLGAQPPTPSWGSMVADGRDLLRVAPWISVVNTSKAVVPGPASAARPRLSPGAIAVR